MAIARYQSRWGSPTVGGSASLTLKETKSAPRNRLQQGLIRDLTRGADLGLTAAHLVLDDNRGQIHLDTADGRT